MMKDLAYIVNFELPGTYRRYKENGGQIDREDGAIINLVTAAEEKKNGILAGYQKKMAKAF